MDEWGRSRLRDVGVSVIDCVHKTPQAQAIGYPYIGIPQMKNGSIDFSTARRISREDYLEWTKKAKPQKFDVILSRRTNPGVTAVDDTATEFALGQNLVLLRSNGAHVYPPFLKWMTLTSEWWDQISKFNNVGAVFDSLKCSDIPKFELPIPPYETQRFITDILDNLDNKIKLNQRINETLEAMARAIFKDWFVDFGPTRTNMRGGVPYLAPQIWSLFPDTLDNEGKPEGWPRGTVSDLIVLQRGFDLPSNSRTEGPYPIIAASGLNGFHNSYMVKGPGVTTGRSGVLGNVFFVHDDFWPLNTSLWIKEFRRATPSYAYFYLQEFDFGVFNAGSAVPTLNRNHIHDLPTILAPAKLINVFDETAMALLRYQENNRIESDTLAATRDLLLPKLMSGEIRVKDAEKIVGQAT